VGETNWVRGVWLLRWWKGHDMDIMQEQDFGLENWKWSCAGSVSIWIAKQIKCGVWDTLLLEVGFVPAARRWIGLKNHQKHALM
jgi:hypothetical protein